MLDVRGNPSFTQSAGNYEIFMKIHDHRKAGKRIY